MGAADARDREVVERVPILFEVPLDLDEAARFEIAGSRFEITCDHGGEGVRGSRAALFFLIRRIASVRDTAEDFPSPLLRVLEYDLPDIAECDAAMLVADLVLSNERAVLAFVADANAQAKARHVFIELDVLSLAGLDFELGDSR